MDPASNCHRYLALTLICLIGFGNYFCYDSPGSLEKAIEESMSVGTSDFTSLYALYSWPNVIMCFFGGLLIDKYLGIRLGAIFFLILLVVGQLFFASGAFSTQFWLMQVGRFIYGLGGESLSVAQNTYVVGWFNGRELNTVFGLMITVSRGGSTLAYNTMYPIYKYFLKLDKPNTALGYTLTVAALTCVISLLTAIVLAYLDKRAERILNRQSLQSEEKISIREATTFKLEFWMLTAICVTFYLTIFPFIAIGAKFLETKYNFNQTQSDLAVSIIYIISAVTSPFIGLLVDKVGRNLTFLLAAGLMVTISHTMLALTYFNVWIPMTILGLGYSVMCSALWPLVTLVVSQRQLGTAYGVMQAFQNLGLAITANLSGALVDWKGYIIVELFFVFWVSMSVILTMILLVQDNNREGSLNMTAAKRKELEAQQLLAQEE